MIDRPHTFGWCIDGHCDNCRGEVVTFYVDPQTGKPVTTGRRTCEHHCHHQEAA